MHRSPVGRALAKRPGRGAATGKRPRSADERGRARAAPRWAALQSPPALSTGSPFPRHQHGRQLGRQGRRPRAVAVGQRARRVARRDKDADRGCPPTPGMGCTSAQPAPGGSRPRGVGARARERGGVGQVQRAAPSRRRRRQRGRRGQRALVCCARGDEGVGPRSRARAARAPEEQRGRRPPLPPAPQHRHGAHVGVAQQGVSRHPSSAAAAGGRAGSNLQQRRRAGQPRGRRGRPGAASASGPPTMGRRSPGGRPAGAATASSGLPATGRAGESGAVGHEGRRRQQGHARGRRVVHAGETEGGAEDGDVAGAANRGGRGWLGGRWLVEPINRLTLLAGSPATAGEGRARRPARWEGERAPHRRSAAGRGALADAGRGIWGGGRPGWARRRRFRPGRGCAGGRRWARPRRSGRRPSAPNAGLSVYSAWSAQSRRIIKTGNGAAARARGNPGDGEAAKKARSTPPSPPSRPPLTSSQPALAQRAHGGAKDGVHTRVPGFGGGRAGGGADQRLGRLCVGCWEVIGKRGRRAVALAPSPHRRAHRRGLARRPRVDRVPERGYRGPQLALERVGGGVRRRRGTRARTRPPFPPPLFYLGRKVDAARGGASPVRPPTRGPGPGGTWGE